MTLPGVAAAIAADIERNAARRACCGPVASAAGAALSWAGATRRTVGEAAREGEGLQVQSRSSMAEETVLSAAMV